MADLLKSLAVLVAGVSLITPAITGKPAPGSPLGWEALAFLLIAMGLILTPES